MTEKSVCWMGGGPQGSGVNVSADLVAKSCVAGGLHVFANIEYNSNIKGEHSFYRVRISTHDRMSFVEKVNLLLALDMETIQKHISELESGGGIIYDGDSINLVQTDKGIEGLTDRTDIKLFPLPLTTTVRDLYGEGKRPNMLMKNTVGVGATLALLDYDISFTEGVIKDQFKNKKPEIAEFNIKAARAGYNMAKKEYDGALDWSIQKQENEKNMFVSGNEAFSIGAIKSGLKYYSYYPITPATPIARYLELRGLEWGVHVEQCEDEIAAICSAVGAGHVGVRSMTGSSGPGFGLMMEGLGFAGITETPIVIAYVQRPGPSTGLPTRQDQADLRFAMHAGHGEAQRIVMLPGDVQECYEFGFESFNYAEKYQIPVIVLSDKYLGESFYTHKPFTQDGMKVDRGLILSENDLKGKEYHRYEITENGVSPRALPGTPSGMFRTTSDEHTTYGKITEEVKDRVDMMNKRFRKMDLAESEIPEASRVKIYGDEDADISIIGWGSTKGTILDVLKMLKSEGIKANYLQILYALPFPSKKVKEFLESAKSTVMVENNYVSPMSGLIREMTGIEVNHKITKYDGRPFSCNLLHRTVKKVVDEKVPHMSVAEEGYERVRT